MAGIHQAINRVSFLGVACLTLAALTLTGCAHDRHTGAVIGAAVGAGIGYVIGNEVERDRGHHGRRHDYGHRGRHHDDGHRGNHRSHRRVVVSNDPYCD